MDYMIEAQNICSSGAIDNQETRENKIICLLNRNMYIWRDCQEEMNRLAKLSQEDPNGGWLEELQKLSKKKSFLRAAINYLFAEFQRRYFD
jgi:hypothetical protein